MIQTSSPARHIAELSLPILIRHTNRYRLGQAISEARLARHNVALRLVQSRVLLLGTRGRKPLPSTLLRLSLHPTLADLWAMLDLLPPLPWTLLLCDDMAIPIIALALFISPNQLSSPTLFYRLYRTIILQIYT